MSSGEHRASSESTKDTGRGSQPELERSSALSLVTVPFKRRLALPAFVLAVLELAGVGYPLWVAFELGELPRETLLGTALPAGIGADQHACGAGATSARVAPWNPRPRPRRAA